MRQFLALFLTPFVLFCAAVPPEAVPPDYLVTEITISCPQESPAPLTVSDQQAMGKILRYLRTVPLRGQADTDSMDSSLPLYIVRLLHTTGRVTEYRQRGAEYIAKGDGYWHHMDPEEGGFLIAFFDDSIYNG